MSDVDPTSFQDPLENYDPPAYGDPLEEALAEQYFDEEIGTDEFLREIDNPGGNDQLLEGTYTGLGGTINAYVKLEGPTLGILQRVLITGDFFVTPPRTVFDLEAALAGTRLGEVEATVQAFFENAEIGMLSAGADDFIAACLRRQQCW